MTLEGPLNKWTNHFHGWQYRYFVLDMNNGLLSYYLFKEHIHKGEIRGCIRLNEAFVGYDKDDDILFTITVGDETYHLQASNLSEKEKWVSHIEKAIILSHTKFSQRRPSDASFEKSKLSEEDIIISVDKFDSTVTELDAYLQLLIEQQKNLESKYKAKHSDDDNLKSAEVESNLNDSDKVVSSNIQSELTNPDEEIIESNEPPSETKNIELMLTSTKALIETVKHSIVCLQVAKVNCDPRNGLHTNNDLKQVLSFFNNNTKSTNLNKKESDKKKIEAGSNILDIPLNSFTISDDEENRSIQNAPKINKRSVSQCSEEVKHKFEDDNDSFYDAVSSGGEFEDTNDGKYYKNPVKTSVDIVANNKNTEMVIAQEYKKETPVLIKSNSKETAVAAAAASAVSDDDEEEFEEDDLDINSQSSVITHLLTQVRIGMDLTKITLPTFILETRSLLEMYADFFAVTEIFLRIPTIKCPHERMIQVVRWYMSTFRAGRKSPVAKKPYNPILGEVFQCWYNLPNESGNSDNKKVISDGPVPWGTSDQLTFVAEQVSHHPPISAFYAEHHDKKVQLEGYTWTKSSFLGLSIAVHMVGKAVVSLIDLDEEYVMTFPSAYGRSILGVPWFEMGGQIQIDCVKTGYQSTIQFLTKPFYGGKKHQITGTICGADKKVLNTIEGDWNATMFLKTGKKTEILINTQSMPLIHKKTRKLKEQLECESRKLWKDVTYNLRSKQIEQATVGKQRIEQKQRDDAKKRKETNTKWQTKYFIENDDHWVYKNPLKKRLQQEATATSI